MGTPQLTVWGVIPVKPFEQGKSRLLLSRECRPATNRAFLDHVLKRVCTALPPGQVIVVSRDDEALAVARRAGARALFEHEGGDLNDAIALGARFAAERGAAGVLSLFADLPQLSVEDIQAMIAAFTGDNLVIAPDDIGSGSNGLLMAPGALPYRHGVNSLFGHLDAAQQAGVPFAIIRRYGLMHDVDTPAQYASIVGQRCTKAL